MKTVPTIGRVVLYWPTEYDNGNNDNGQPMAATVAYVHNEGMVNLAVVDHNGNPFGKSSVTMVDEEIDAKAGQCEWMPYQKEQAIKNEE